ncbi:hypothetical protein niasHT_022674 [Heterodera trifolii]|uniref:C3H1-type domain-containing protein n=1 Tax=Heterodera trifolii TaxID=157864 RepID=A0ABD2JRH5_9BILA
MELEEGEYVEEEELFTRNQRQKNKFQLNGEHLNSSALKRRREEDDYETVSMELESDPEMSKESKTTEHHSEDEVELLRRQLLSQVQMKKAKKQTMNERVSEMQKEMEGSENLESTERMNDLQRMSEKLRQLNEQLTEAQLLQSTIVRRKKRLQDSLIECEEELTRSQKKVSSVVEEIVGLWSQAAKDGLKATLSESKKEINSRRISTDKENTHTLRTSEKNLTAENSSKRQRYNKEANMAAKSANLDQENRKKGHGNGKDNEDEKSKKTIRRDNEENPKKTREGLREENANVGQRGGREERRKSSSTRYSLTESMTVTVHAEKQNDSNSQTERTVIAKGNANETTNSRNQRVVETIGSAKEMTNSRNERAKGSANETTILQTERAVETIVNAKEMTNSRHQRTIVDKGNASEMTNSQTGRVMEETHGNANEMTNSVAKGSANETTILQTARVVETHRNANEMNNSVAKGSANETTILQTERVVETIGNAKEMTNSRTERMVEALQKSGVHNNVLQQRQEVANTEENIEKGRRKNVTTEDIFVEEQQREVAETASLSRLISGNDRIDGFLASIRAYRLNPRFSHRLLAHHSISNRLDPFVPLCPFQLHGRCADKNCPWQHENEYRMSEVDIVSEVIALWPNVCPRGMLPDEYATNLLANDRLEVVIGFLLSIMPEEAFSIRLDACSRIPRLPSKPIPTEESIEFVSLLSTKHFLHGSSTPIC